jgi:hypothetical protein
MRLGKFCRRRAISGGDFPAHFPPLGGPQWPYLFTYHGLGPIGRPIYVDDQLMAQLSELEENLETEKKGE